MAKVDPAPDEEALEQRRKPRYIVDPKDVTAKDEDRARAWALEIMQKHEHKFTKKWKETQIVTSGEVTPEDIDIRGLYPFPELNWIIYKLNGLWHLMLRSREKMIFISTYARV